MNLPALVRLVVSLAAAGVPGPQSASVTPTAPAAAAPAPALPGAWAERGHSGALKVMVADPEAPLDEALGLEEAQRASLRYRWVAPSVHAGEALALTAGLRAPPQPGVWALQLGAAAEQDTGLRLITPVRYDGTATHLNGYHLGRWPAGAAERLGEAYVPPARLIEVTPANQDTSVSEHFQLRDFLTHDQQDVWPKYLVLDLALVDKLELVLQELRAEGFPARDLHVMSGFRTPQYNGPGLNGRARFSRHTYGDAADVWVDDDGDGRMDDLNRDGRVDVRDAEVLAAVVDRVEARVPELVGGHGVYRATRVHGPFVHVDVRGTAARWAKR